MGLDTKEGGMNHGRRVPLGPVSAQIERMKALRAKPVRDRSIEEVDELERLEEAHIRRLRRIPYRILELEAQIAQLKAMAA